MKKSALIGAIVTVLSLGMVSMASALVSRQWESNVTTSVEVAGQPMVQYTVGHDAVSVEGDGNGAIVSLSIVRKTVDEDGNPIPLANGAVVINTADTATWSVAVPAGTEKWTFTTRAVNANSAGIYLDGVWVPFKKGTTITVSMVGSRTRLYVKTMAFTAEPTPRLIKFRPITYGASFARVP